jgi:peroxiredoxin
MIHDHRILLPLLSSVKLDPLRAWSDGAAMIQIRDLRMGSPAPNFRLTSLSGAVLELRQYRHRQPLVLFLMHDLACLVCQSRLVEFQRQVEDYRAENVELIAVLPASDAEAAVLVRRLGLSFVVLTDPERVVHTLYLGDSDQAGLFVLDRYNGQQIALRAQDADSLLAPADALQWAVFSETTCPECGVLEWPTGE